MKTDWNQLTSLRFPHDSSPGEGLTTGLAKGVCMFEGLADLSEEGMGFGVPVVVSRWRTYLSYKAPTIETSPDGSLIKKVYYLDAVQNIGDRTTTGVWPYMWLETKGLVYKSLPRAQRWLLDKRDARDRTPKVTFVRASSLAIVPVEYRIGENSVSVTADLSALNSLPGRSRIYILNEQGGRSFPIYRENDRASLTGIDGGWVIVSAAAAGFAAADGGKWFNLKARPGAAMFRGREIVDGRLSWSGIEYSISGYQDKRFSYQVNTGGTSRADGGSS